MIRVLVVDDQTLVRGALRMLLDAQPDLSVVGEAGDGAQAVAACEKVRPDVVVMDIRMPRLDGVEATRRIVALESAHPPRVLVLTTFDLDEYVYAALRAGAAGFMLKDARPEELVGAVRAIAAGDSLLAPSVTRRLIETFVRRLGPSEPSRRRLAELTARELDVLRLVARGLSNAEIATELVLGENTVKSHVGHILDKLGLRNRVEAAILAYEAGGMEEPPDLPT